MKKIYKTVSIFVLLLLVISLLPAGGLGVVRADSDKEDKRGDILERIVEESGEEYAAKELIVKFRGDDRPFRIVKLAGGKSVREAEREFEARGDVEYAEPNYIAHAFLTPNDPYYSLQWHLNNAVYGGIHTEPAWDLSRGTGVSVAVIDTGVAYENYRNPVNGKRYYRAPDLASTCFSPGYDYVEKDTHPNDDNSHGTHVAGTVGQSTNNSTGVAGVAFESCLMPVKVLDRNGSGTYANVAAGIRFAADNGAKVINLSLGGSAPSQTLLDAVAYAYGKGVTVIAAAGNDGINVISYPAAYDNYVIAVGATRYDETRASYSNYGVSLDLVAPGGDLTVDQNSDGYGDGVLQNTFNPNTKSRSDFGYWFFQGTSMATPHVAGVAALVISKGVIGPDNVRAALENTAEDLGTAGRDNTYGWGLVDASAAVKWTLIPPIPNNPPVANNQSVIINEDTALSITLSAIDPENDPLTYSIVSQPTNGILSGAAPNVTYTPKANYNGPDSFTFKANDGKVDSNIATVSITINSVNDPPVAKAGAPQTVTDTDGNGTELATLNGSASFDPDGTIASYEWKEDTTILGTGTIVAFPFAVGMHTVTLTVVDNLGAQASDVTTVTVNPKPSVPADIVEITRAEYNPGISRLDVRATSSQGGIAVLTVEGFGVMTYNPSKNRYQLTVQGVANPGTVTVTSSLGGTDTVIVVLND